MGEIVTMCSYQNQNSGSLPISKSKSMVSSKNLIEIPQWKADGVVAEKVKQVEIFPHLGILWYSLNQTIIPKKIRKTIQKTSKLIEANPNDDNISVYYSKAINRYERQKRKDASKGQSVYTEMQPKLEVFF